MRTKLRPVARAIDLPSEVLPTPGGPHQAKNRTFDLTYAVLDRQILDDPLLDLFQAVMVFVENALGGKHVPLHPGPLLPGDPEYPVEIVANDRRLGGHRTHAPQLLELRRRFLRSFLGEAGVPDCFFDLRKLVAAFPAVAQLLLDRLHLFVQIVLALRAFHLALDARADTLLDLQDIHLAFHVGIDALQTLEDRYRFQQFLLLSDLETQMRRHSIGKL